MPLFKPFDPSDSDTLPLGRTLSSLPDTMGEYQVSGARTCQRARSGRRGAPCYVRRALTQVDNAIRRGCGRCALRCWGAALGAPAWRRHSTVRMHDHRRTV